MFKRLLVPLDGSRLAESVLPVVKTLANLFHCSVMLMHVMEKSPPSSIHGDTHLRDAGKAEAYLENMKKRLSGEGLAVEAHVHTVPQGDIPRCIAEHAVELDQDLIVLCSHGAGGVRRFVFGSNAEQVLSHGSTPVLLVKAADGEAREPFHLGRMLVLVDEMPVCLAALDAASDFARHAGAHLELMAVVPTLGSMGPEQAASGRFAPRTTRHVLEMAAEEAAENLRREVLRLVRENGIAASGRVERGDTAAAVIEVAQRNQAALVVIASRGLAGLKAFWAEEVTRKVAAGYGGALLLIPACKL